VPVRAAAAVSAAVARAAAALSASAAALGWRWAKACPNSKPLRSGDVAAGLGDVAPGAMPAMVPM